MTKTIGKTIPTINPDSYSKLLTEVLPKIIETEIEYEQTLAKVEQLTFTKNKTIEQQTLLKLLVLLVEQYETENYPLETPTPHEILQHLIESSGIKQIDLVGVIGSSGVVSEVINGKRSISKTQAQALGAYFKVLPSLFI
jgi:HTH-type transcriptional regulator / antitoxin HigA